MTNCKTDRAQIIVGSKATFSIFVIDKDERAIDLNDYVSGKLVFCNCSGVRTEITLAIPGSNPTQGEIAVSITDVQSANADKNWESADLELVDGSAETTLILLNNKFEVYERNCPPVA